MSILLHPTYFPNIAHFVVFANSDAIWLETMDNYQKQTYRNRTHIYSANGLLSLTVPVIYSQKNRQLYKDVKIANDSKWQALHWKSLQSAYRTSPFYEYYEDELAPLFHEKQHYVLEFNFKCLHTILDCLQMDANYRNTTVFEKNPEERKDLRYLVNARKEASYTFDSYTQVFSNKHGFISNLSILDLLFNEGPNALNYLESQNIFW